MGCSASIPVTSRLAPANRKRHAQDADDLELLPVSLDSTLLPEYDTVFAEGQRILDQLVDLNNGICDLTASVQNVLSELVGGYVVDLSIAPSTEHVFVEMLDAEGVATTPPMATLLQWMQSNEIREADVALALAWEALAVHLQAQRSEERTHLHIAHGELHLKGGDPEILTAFNKALNTLREKLHSDSYHIQLGAVPAAAFGVPTANFKLLKHPHAHKLHHVASNKDSTTGRGSAHSGIAHGWDDVDPNQLVPVTVLDVIGCGIASHIDQATHDVVSAANDVARLMQRYPSASLQLCPILGLKRVVVSGALVTPAPSSSGSRVVPALRFRSSDPTASCTGASRSATPFMHPNVTSARRSSDTASASANSSAPQLLLPPLTSPMSAPSIATARSNYLAAAARFNAALDCTAGVASASLNHAHVAAAVGSAASGTGLHQHTNGGAPAASAGSANIYSPPSSASQLPPLPPTTQGSKQFCGPAAVFRPSDSRASSRHTHNFIRPSSSASSAFGGSHRSNTNRSMLGMAASSGAGKKGGAEAVHKAVAALNQALFQLCKHCAATAFVRSSPLSSAFGRLSPLAFFLCEAVAQVYARTFQTLKFATILACEEGRLHTETPFTIQILFKSTADCMSLNMEVTADECLRMQQQFPDFLPEQEKQLWTALCMIADQASAVLLRLPSLTKQFDSLVDDAHELTHYVHEACEKKGLPMADAVRCVATTASNTKSMVEAQKHVFGGIAASVQRVAVAFTEAQREIDADLKTKIQKLSAVQLQVTEKTPQPTAQELAQALADAVNWPALRQKSGPGSGQQSADNQHPQSSEDSQWATLGQQQSTALDLAASLAAAVGVPHGEPGQPLQQLLQPQLPLRPSAAAPSQAGDWQPTQQKDLEISQQRLTSSPLPGQVGQMAGGVHWGQIDTPPSPANDASNIVDSFLVTASHSPRVVHKRASNSSHTMPTASIHTSNHVSIKEKAQELDKPAAEPLPYLHRKPSQKLSPHRVPSMARAMELKQKEEEDQAGDWNLFKGASPRQGRTSVLCIEDDAPVAFHGVPLEALGPQALTHIQSGRVATEPYASVKSGRIAAETLTSIRSGRTAMDAVALPPSAECRVGVEAATPVKFGRSAL